MTKLYISEYADVPQQIGGTIPMGIEPMIADQVVDYSGGATASNAFDARTKFVRIHTDAICSIRFTTAGSAATTSNKRMAAGATEYFGVGENRTTTLKVNAISNT